MERNQYKSILKGTSVFGGVQVVQILLNLVRGKFVALFLGPAGMGVNSLFNSASLSLQRFCSLGLNLAIVREVADKSESEEALKQTMTVARRLITVTALFGLLVCAFLSTWLSRATFGNDTMQMQFVLLGVAVALGILYNGNLSIMQGVRDLKGVGRCSIAGGVAGVAVGVPLYWLWGVDGIVPAMIAMALAMWIFSCISLRKQAGKASEFSWSRHGVIVRRLVWLGLILMAGDLFQAVAQYLINIYVNHSGSESAVGLYQAANSVTNQYSGMVFTALAMDYFPRLTKDASDNVRMGATVNRQTEITSLVIAPAVALLILTAPLAIRILLTTEFLEVTPLMRWMGLGVLFRALMVPMGYITFAKGNRKLFFWMEAVMCNVLTLVLSCGFFHFFGLMGLGYALVADNLLCLGIYYAVNSRLYGYRFSRGAAKCMLGAIILGGAVFGASLVPSTPLSYSLMTIAVIATAAWSLLLLRSRLSSRP